MKENRKSWLIASLFLLVIGGAANAKTIYVDADRPPGGGGTNWSDAYKYLQDALADANVSAKPVEIRVAQGTYKPDEGAGVTDGDREATFGLINGVTLKGGYAGFGEADPDARDVSLYETILSGDLDGDDEDFTNNDENSYHVVTGTNTSETAILDGFTITAGNADGPYYLGLGSGGGMYNYENASPTLTNCTFRRNWARHSGGGMYNRSASNLTHPTLTNCAFNGNYAKGSGGAIMFRTIGNAEFTTLLTNCIFSGNSVSWLGGGIDNLGSDLTLNNCTFVGNWVEFDMGTGGAMRIVDRGRQTITNCIFWANLPNQFGGDVSDASIRVTHSDIQGAWLPEWYDKGNIDADPCFANPDANDFHLKSQAGRWNPTTENWVIDAVTSPCIDGGDPDGSIGYELFPNGGRVNMGAYGGMIEASKSYFGEPICDKNIAGDINGDCKVDFLDFAIMAGHWLWQAGWYEP